MSDSESPVDVANDPDIGRCDDCGSDEGERTAEPRAVTVQGKPVLLRVWLCAQCREQREGRSPR